MTFWELRPLEIVYIDRSSRGFSMAGNSYCFHKLTPESFYWLGWMATDGCLIKSKDGWLIKLVLKESDKACVERFAKFIGAKPPRQRKKCGSWETRVLNNVMGARLIELGITQRKSKTLLVAEELTRSPYFWRGAFEGDGGYYETPEGNLQLALTSYSRGFLEQLRGFYGYYDITPNNKSWKAQNYCGNARRLLRKLYDGTYPTLALERKQTLVHKWVR